MLSKIAKPERFKISLPPWFHEDLSYWAWLKGTDRARLAANILQARIEANKELINSQLEEVANRHDISVDQLKSLIRKDGIKNESPTND